MNCVVKYALCANFFMCGAMYGFGQKTIFGVRSQSVNSVRDLVGTQQLLYPFNNKDLYNVFSVTADYNRSFRSDKVAEYLFGSKSLTFTGSRSGPREETDILSDYFGLPPDFRSIVMFKPRITNFIIDFNWFLGLDNIAEGLYFRADLPIVHAKWDLNLCETVFNKGTAFHPAGYLGDSRLIPAQLPKTIKQAFEGNKAFGDVKEPLKFGKINGRQAKTHTSDFQALLGYNFWQEYWYRCGAYMRVVAPVGNRTNGKFLFEPIIGNMHHWELGGGITSEFEVWKSHDDAGMGDKTCHKIMFYLDANITHLFSSLSKRSYDFMQNGPGSRYILIEEILAPSVNLAVGAAIGQPGSMPTPTQYTGRLLPAINKTTLNSKISIAAQTDIVAKFSYQRKGLEVDLGYNFYGRSREKLHCRQTFASNKFAFKGDAQIYGFKPNETAVKLSASQSKATVRAGQGEGNSDFINNNADNSVQAFSDTVLDQLLAQDAEDLGIKVDDVQTSNPALLIKDEDINNDSGLMPRATSHKLFAHVGYVWREKDEVIVPFLGVGVQGEWADASVRSNSITAQWGVWLKGGAVF